MAGSTCVRVTSYQTLIPFLGIYVSLAVRNPRAQQTGEPAVVAQVLTKDHKPDDPEETRLIESLGGFLTFTCMYVLGNWVLDFHLYVSFGSRLVMSVDTNSAFMCML